MRNLSEILRDRLNALIPERGERAFALRAQVDPSLLNRFLKGETSNLELKTIEKLAAAANFKPWELLREEVEPEARPTFSEAARILIAYEMAPPQIRDVVEAALAGVDVEAGLTRLRQLQQGSKSKTS